MSTLDEFSLINKFFNNRQANTFNNAQILVPIGDDCAALKLAPAEILLTSCDTLVENQHFFANVNPQHLGHKALAVNLSDLAACGGQPLAFTLALTLPSIDEQWLAAFSDGLFTLAQQYNCALIGGDTTRGPLSITITVFGSCPTNRAILRCGAQLGDDIYVSGTLGDARAGLAILRNSLSVTTATSDYFIQRLELPTPRVELGLRLRGIASAAADLSDGLVGDLQHILTASKLGANLVLEKLLASASPQLSTLAPHLASELMLSGGDDYELVFCAGAQHRDSIQRLSKELQLSLTPIGSIVAQQQLVITKEHQPFDRQLHSFNHFAD